MNKIERRNLIKASLGLLNSTLKLENANLINVFSGEIYLANIYIYKEFIVDVVQCSKDKNKPVDKIINLNGKCLSPGFIDSHMHIESTHLTPYNFAQIAIPKGTTTVIADPHEIVNVLGEEGLDYMLQASENLPMNQYFLIPSCVPSVLNLENSGAVVGTKDIEKWLNKDRILGLGEIMDFLGVINCEERMEDIIDVAYQKGKFLQGHAPGLTDEKLSAYLCGGPVSCHETRDGFKAIEKIRKGMFVDARESSMSKNITSIVENILSKGLKSPRNFTLCTDDREPKDIIENGHINNCLKIAVKAGLDPIEAIRAVTINPAQEVGLEKLGSVAPGYFADMVVFDNLKDFNVEKTFYRGELVSEFGEMKKPIEKKELEIEKRNTVYISNIGEEQLKIRTSKREGIIKIKGISYEDTKRTFTRLKEFQVPVKDYFIDLSSTDLNFVAIINRHKGNSNISLGIVENFTMKKGAVGTTYSHDSHNMTIIYRDPKDALVIANRLKKIGGGVVIGENGIIKDEVNFSIAGMLSNENANSTGKNIERINLCLKDMGLECDSPITRPSSLALIVIPEVKISDVGIIDVSNKKIIEQF